MFANRSEAGRLLGERLAAYRDRHPVVLALPRGGVPVALEIAKALAAPLDVLLVRKLGAPWQPELAVGAVVDGDDPITVTNDEVMRLTGADMKYVEQEARRQLAEIERRRQLYLAGRPPVAVTGKTAIVVDDGIATGATMRAGLRALARRRPERLILAVPVAAADTLEALRAEVDEVVCLYVPADLWAIGAHYRDFRQLTDEEVIAQLDEAQGLAGGEHDRSSVGGDT